MRDEQVGDTQFCLQALQQIENLCLHRDIERGGRLVADQEFRLYGQRPRDGDALALAPENSCG
jgi:hypothetical protein